MTRRPFTPGEPVIYALTKHSEHPGPRAKEIQPAPHGNDYTYYVEKFWIVLDVLEDGRLLLGTRRGKRREVDPNDPQLRRPRWWERIVYRHKFPDPRKLGVEV